MALTTFERTGAVASALSRILTENGYIDIAPSSFLGQLVGVLEEALGNDFTAVYDIAENVDIGRARGEYLDRWGSLLAESRESLTYAQELALDNVSIYLDPEVTAGAITTDLRPIEIPAGTIISDDTEKFMVEILDNARILADRSRAYVRVIALRPGELYIAPGSLTKVHLDLSNIANVMPSAFGTYVLRANNDRAISGGTVSADDETYRYVLQQKSQSIGLFNENRVNSLLDIEDIVSVTVQRYTGGANIYIDVKDVSRVDQVVESARAALRGRWILGESVNVFAPVERRLAVSMYLDVLNADNLGITRENAKSALIDRVNDLRMGAVISLDSIMNDIMSEVDNIRGYRFRKVTYASRTVTGGSIGQAFNSRAIISEGDVTFT